MVGDWWRKVRAFIKHNLIGLIAVSLAVLLGIGAGALWSGEVSYTYPGPAIATVELAIVILLVGLVINNFQAQNQDLQAQKQNLSAKVTHLQEELKQPSRLPSIIGLEVLVNRWQKFNPN